jgi:L-ascorbate metabolism protein UlaG (beta-lactamase superfamily)
MLRIMDDASDDMVDELTITWLGHAGIVIRHGPDVLAFDPVVRWRIAHLRRRSLVARASYAQASAVFVSHAHHDHLDLASLRRVRDAARADASWYAPRGAARVLERAGFAPVVRMTVDDEVAVGALRVRSVPAAHGGDRGGPRRDEAGAEAIGFVVERSDGLRVWFAGDTDLDSSLARIGQVDVALVPVGGWWRTLGPGHMDAERAARALELVGARVAIPIHWGTYHPIGLWRAMRQVWHEPARALERLAPLGVDVRVLDPGEAITIGRRPAR